MSMVELKVYATSSSGRTIPVGCQVDIFLWYKIYLRRNLARVKFDFVYLENGSQISSEGLKIVFKTTIPGQIAVVCVF